MVDRQRWCLDCFKIYHCLLRCFSSDISGPFSRVTNVSLSLFYFCTVYTLGFIVDICGEIKTFIHSGRTVGRKGFKYSAITLESMGWVGGRGHCQLSSLFHWTDFADNLSAQIKCVHRNYLREAVLKWSGLYSGESEELIDQVLTVNEGALQIHLLYLKHSFPAVIRREAGIHPGQVTHT